MENINKQERRDDRILIMEKLFTYDMMNDYVFLTKADYYSDFVVETTAEMMMGTAKAVVINEALEIVKVYSDQGDGSSVRFVNKVLDNISKNIER